MSNWLNKKAEGKYTVVLDGIKYVWNGGTGINAYDNESGKEIDYFNIGGGASNPPLSEAKRVIKQKHKDLMS